MPISPIALYIDPPSHHFLEDRLFNPNQAQFAGDQLLAPYFHMRERLIARDISVHTADLLPETIGENAYYLCFYGKFGQL